MASATAAREAARKDGEIVNYLVEAGDVIYKGTLVILDGDGYLKDGADAASHTFAGVAVESASNSGGADGAKACRVWKSGVFRLAASSAAQSWVGQEVCIADNQTVALAATTANDIKAGRVVEVLSSASVAVRIDGYC
jgi:predicted RecA/RadA family phage recombinase